MKRILAILLLSIAGLNGSAHAGLIFDNGSGDKNDTLVIQFCLLDSAGARYTTWDTAYVVQAFGGVDFNTDTLLNSTNYRLNSVYPRNLMFEYRIRAGDGNSSHIGAYTWWVFLVDSNNGADTHQMQSGCYYVNSDPIEDFLTVADTAASGALGRVIRDALGDSMRTSSVPDSVIARIDSIRWALGMPMSIAGEKYSNNLHSKIGPYLGGSNDNLKNAVDALSLTGGGSEACTLLVRQNGSAPIRGARTVIRSLDQSATRVPGIITDINGRSIVELDEAAYFISVTANNYIPLSDTIYVNRDSTWQISLNLFNPGNPPSPDLCRVYGWVSDIGGGNPENVTISAEIPSDYLPIKYGGVIITPFKKSTSSDSSGYWQIDLLPNSVLSKADSKYIFTIEYPSGVIMKSKVTVPDSTSWLFR